jgi:hypothetical protein
MKIMKLLFLIIFFLSFESYSVNACTTALISGKYTVDGRPLLFKHRDSDYMQNKLMFFSDGKYKYIGLVNTPDTLGREVWGGCNSAGFAIINSASYNLKGNDTTKLADREGIIMKLALQNCATVDEFEKLLNDLPKPLGVEANFGVIDANGNGAYFETNNFKYTKYDVNDPKVAPNGYIIRTNHSLSGIEGEGAGYIRFSTEEDLFKNASKNNDFSCKFLLEEVSRCLKHSLTGADLTANLPKNSSESCFKPFEDFIPRYSSTSSILIQGVRKGEFPGNATIWTILGFPLTSIAVPVWVVGGNRLPEILTMNEKGYAPLCNLSLTLKKQCFSYPRDGYKKYINVAALMNQEKTGIMQKLLPIEKNILKETEKKMEEWMSGGLRIDEVQKYYGWLDGYIKSTYSDLFGLK